MRDMVNNDKNNPKLRDMLAIGDAAKYLGVSIDTLRRWEKKDRIVPLRSPGGHRYYEKKDLDELFGVKYTRDESGPSTTKTETQIPNITPIPTSNPTPNKLKSPIDYDVSLHHSSTLQVADLPTPPTQEPEQPRQTDVIKSGVKIPVIKPIIFIKTYETDPPPPTPPPVPSRSTSMPQPKEEPEVEKVQIKEELSEDQQQKLDNILVSDKKPKRKTDKTKVVILAVVIFAILDVILFLVWQRPTTILSPVP